MTGGARADLVLVGGGHAHVQVLRRWMMRPVSGVRLTVVLDRPEAVYSGMVPGLVAGDYTASELAIDVVPLARRAGASVVLAAATRVDAVARRIALDGRPSLAYDVASLDVGSTVRGLDLPGVRQHALATRPVGDLVARLEAAVRAAAARRAGASLRVVVVGGGVAGVELACTLRARILAAGAVPAVTVVADSADVLPGYPAHVARRMAREASRRGITLRTGTRATGVEPDAVVLGTERLASDLSLWATGAAPGPLLAASDLPHDAAGFVRVETTLAVVGHDGLFAVGDCAAIAGAPFVRKAGVYAVREGPILDANLRARLGGRPLRRYRPQRAFLALVNLGEGRALAFKWRCVAAGRWVWRWKDSIDRRFVRRFQVLDARGAPLPAFSATMDGAGTMRCGGCAAKVSAAALERALARLGPPREDASVLLGLGRPDDAAALVLPAGRVQLATVDAFRAFAPDPWLVGRVAAVNAVSDVLAKGGVARHALA